MKLQRDVFIAGVGETRFGRSELEFDALGRLAALEALRSSNIERPGQVQSAYIGNATNGMVTGQTVLKDLGMCGTHADHQRRKRLLGGWHGCYMRGPDVAIGATDLSSRRLPRTTAAHRQRHRVLHRNDRHRDRARRRNDRQVCHAGQPLHV